MDFSPGLWFLCPLADMIPSLLLTEHMYKWDIVCFLTSLDTVKVSECFPSESLGTKLGKQRKTHSKWKATRHSALGASCTQSLSFLSQLHLVFNWIQT